MARAANLDEYRRSKVTIREIADLAGVSIATVSRVVNGRADVAPETRDARACVIVQSDGYMTNRSARALSGGRTGHIGLTMPLMRGDYFAAILEGALEAVYEEDMRLVLYTTLHEHDREVSVLERLADGATDGSIITAPAGVERRARGASGERLSVRRRRPAHPPRRRHPRRLGGAPGGRIGGDRAPPLARASPHRPRQRPAQAGPQRRSASRATTARSQRRASLPTSDLIVEGNFEAPSGVAAGLTSPRPADPPTAIFASNDNMAAGVLQAAHERGLTVPGDLSVVGFDDADLATILSPALTTVRQPLAELGRTGVSLLTRMLERQRVEALRVELATRLVVRESTGPPPER